MEPKKPKFPVVSFLFFLSCFLFGVVGLLTRPSIVRDENGSLKIMFRSPTALLESSKIEYCPTSEGK